MIVEMKKLMLLAHASRRNRVLRALHRSKLVMAVSTAEIEDTQNPDVSADTRLTSEKLSRVAFAIDFLAKEKKKGLALLKEIESQKSKDAQAQTFNYSPIKADKFQTISRISYDEFVEIPHHEVELLAQVENLENIEKSYAKINAEIQKAQALIEHLEVFACVDTPSSAFCDTAVASSALGAVPIGKTQQLQAVFSEFPEAQFEIYGAGLKYAAFAFVCFSEHFSEIMTRLQNLEYFRAQNYDIPASEYIANLKANIAEWEKEKELLLETSLKKEVHLPDFKLLHDYYLVDLAKASAAGGTRCTRSVFVLEGWFPAKEEERLSQILNECCDEMIYEFRTPEENEEPPTLVQSKKLFDPYEDVTNMYNVPNVREDIDPNPVMSFFYFLFFGMMIADAGYGLILTLAGFLLYWLKKPVKGKGRMLLIIGSGGISTIIWGILFGSWFGLTLPEGFFLRRLIWFEPLANPLMMLGVSLALGFFQILVGMGVNAYNLIRKHKTIDAIFAVFTWYAVFIGIGLLALNALLVKNGALNIAAVVLIAAGLLAMVLGNARGRATAKDKVKGALAGFAKIYDGVNFLSDILSYSRLFGLALSGGVVGMVINQICMVFMGLLPSFGGVPVLGILVAIPIFIGGHLFNIGIGALGAYVHTCRLQYIEFYGKFYSGGGYLFKPLGAETKYTFITETAEKA